MFFTPSACRLNNLNRYNDPKKEGSTLRDDTAPTIMTLHEAVPAKGVLKLMNADAAGTR